MYNRQSGARTRKQPEPTKPQQPSMSKHERTKSSGGGLLDSWFGRPKTKSKGYTPSNGGGGGSGRPVSLESEALADMQDITNQIHMLTIEEVNQKFMEILEDMNIPKDKRQPLLLKSLEEKREMLIMKGNNGSVVYVYTISSVGGNNK